MNTLKPLLICAVLAGIGYGVYVRINDGGDPPPPGAPQDWNAPPEVQMGDSPSPGGAPAWPATAGSASGAAPPFAAPPSAPSAPTSLGGQAPPFTAAPPPGATADAGLTPPPFDSSASGIPPVAGQSPGDPAMASPQIAVSPGNPTAQAPPLGAAEQVAPNSGPSDPYAAPPVGTAPAGTPDRYAAPDAPVADRYSTPATPGAPPAAGAAPPTGAPAEGGFAEVMEAARRDLEAGQMTNALAQLSSWYDDPRLAPAERQQLNQMLDQVAGTVVYSTQHLLEPPYEVQPGEKLEDIGERYSVPWKLLAKINGIDDPSSLRAGERLKVIRGPFNAVVSLEKRELTLVLPNGSYAGRFPIGIGREQPPREGTYAVSDKVVDPVYHGRETAAGAGDEGNPLGQRWIGLGSDLGIHGTNRPENIGRTDLPGSISLSPRDVEDVFDILATGSKVTIRR